MRTLPILFAALLVGCAPAPQASVSSPSHSSVPLTAVAQQPSPQSPQQQASPQPLRQLTEPDDPSGFPDTSGGADFIFEIEPGVSYRFYLVGNDKHTFERIVVSREGTAEPVQELVVPEMHEVRRADGYFGTIDANFDGAQDIKLAAAWGAGPNGLDHFWLFDTENRRFVYDERLSGISNVEVDPATKTIKSSARDNAVHDIAQTYRYLDGRLTLVEQIDDTHSDERGGYSRVTKKLKNGKLRVVKKEFVAEPK